MTDTRCYMVVIADLTDREKFLAGYAKEVPPLVERFGGRYVIKGAGGQFLEESWCEHPSVLVSEWPDRETALAFWNSPEYAHAKTLRAGTGRFQVALIDSPPMSDGI